MPRQVNTKEKILDAALELFATRGYDKVKMSDIATKVGCAPGALYKHYPSKEDVYEAMIERSMKGFQYSMQMIMQEVEETFAEVDSLSQVEVDSIIKLFLKRFDMAIHFRYSKLFRMLMTVEQYQRPELAEIYNDRYIYYQNADAERMIKKLIEKGFFKQGDPKAMAMLINSPFTLMIGVVDRSPEKEDWAKEQLEIIIREFCRVYLVNL